MSIPSRSSILNTIPGLIAEHFNLDAVPPLDAPLYDQMHFDSLQMIELVSLVEELAGLAPGESPAEYPIL
jgi:acyl carrier protein